MVEESAKSRGGGSKFKSSADLIVLILLLCTFTAGVVLVFWRESNRTIERVQDPIGREAERIFSRIERILERAVMVKLTSQNSVDKEGEGGGFPRSFLPNIQVYANLDGDSSTGGYRVGSSEGLEKLIIGTADMRGSKLYARLFGEPQQKPRSAVLSEYMDMDDPVPFGAYMTVDGSRKRNVLLKKSEKQDSAKLTIRLVLAKNNKERTFSKSFQLKP